MVPINILWRERRVTIEAGPVFVRAAEASNTDFPMLYLVQKGHGSAIT
jgi:hypothetical protein